jgi:hypothetical protein
MSAESTSTPIPIGSGEGFFETTLSLDILASTTSWEILEILTTAATATTPPRAEGKTVSSVLETVFLHAKQAVVAVLGTYVP